MGQDPGFHWRSMSEDAPPPRAPRPPRSDALPDAIRAGRSRLRNLYLLTGGLCGLALALLVVFVVRTRSHPPPPPPPAPVVKAPPPPKPKMAAPKPAGPKTVPEQMKELVEREKATPKAFRTLHDAWADLRREAPAEALEEIREQMERLQAAATKEYRVLYHDVHEKVRDLLGAHEPREAQKLLRDWRVPSELDVAGDLAEDVKKELASIEQLIDFEGFRTKLFTAYRAGDFSTDAATLLSPYLKASQVHVRAEADNALAELKLIRALGLLTQKLGARRAGATARVEEVKRQIAADAAVEKDRTAAWEARLKERTQKKPIPIAQLGVKDMEVALKVSKYNGRSVAFAGEGMELTLSMDDLPMELYGRLMLDAPDPAKPAELLEAGKLAVRRNALAAARTLFDLAVKADRSVAELVPDLSRLSAGIGTFRGPAELQGEQLSLRYDFQSGDQAKDFKISTGAKLVSTAGVLSLEGDRMFTALLGELKFQGKLRITADPVSISGPGGYILGVASEVTPGDPDLFVALVQPDRGYRVLRLRRRGGEPQVLGEGALAGRSGILELAIDGGKAEFRSGGVTTWSGELPDFGLLQPVIGGNSFEGRTIQVSYRSLKFEGRASPEWIRRLQSERQTMIESELSKEQRTTRQERAASGFEVGRSFGDGMESPLPLEAELADVVPPRVRSLYAAARATLKKLEDAKTDKEIWRLAGQVRQTLEEAIREAPWFPLTYYYRAEWRYDEGDIAGAMRDLVEAAARQEGFVEARLARADLLVRQAKYPDAEKELDAALASVPDLARARLTRALLHYYAGREAEAIAELELARRLEPGDAFLRRSAKRLRNIVAGPRWSGVVALETPQYLIRAESPRLAKKNKKEDPDKLVRERIQKYADHLDGVRTYFSQLVPGAENRQRKPLVYICDTPESYYVYADFTSEDRLEHTTGVYLGQYRQLLFFRAESDLETLQTMTHEAFHEYLHAVVPAAPIWLNEGMAEYAAGVTIEGGRATAVGGILRGRLRNLQSALESGWEGFAFEFVLQESREQFYSLSPQLQYAQAWSMIHFMMHGKGGKYQPLLDQYVQALKDSKSAVEAKKVFAETDLVAMKREWLSYVKSLRP